VDTEPATPRPSRIDRVTDLVIGIMLLVGAVWGGVNAGTATWDASVLLVRGETVSATVVAVEHRYKLGRMDDVVVALPPPHGGQAELTTPREDLEPGAVVATVVDPADPSRAALDEDGWPWRTTLPLLLVPLLALAGLFALGRAVFGRPSTREAPDESEDTAQDTAAQRS